MTRVTVARDLEGPTLESARLLWADTARWPSWVDGLARVTRVDAAWPDPGANVEWESNPGGRGLVRERVTDASPAQIRTEQQDDRLSAVQTARFEELEGGVGVEVALSYTLTGGGPLRALVDLLFIRRAIADSLRRTMDRFAAELAEPPVDPADPDRDPAR